MPTFTPLIPRSFFGADTLFDIFEQLISLDPAPEDITSTGFTATLDGIRFEVGITDLTVDTDGSAVILTGGTLNSINTFDAATGEAQASITGATFDVTDIIEAQQQEQNGVVDAYEDLIFNEDWLILSPEFRIFDVGNTRSEDDVRLLFSGNDVFNLSAENDIIAGVDGRDRIFGNDGNDFIAGGNGGDHLRGGKGHDVVLGGENRDLVSGGKGNDNLSGGGAIDRLFGDGGKDVLRGGKGRDILTGGAGADRFDFVKGDADDRITDFEVGLDAVALFDFQTFDGDGDGEFDLGQSGTTEPLFTVALGDSGFVELDYEGGTILFEGITDISGVQNSVQFLFSD